MTQSVKLRTASLHPLRPRSQTSSFALWVVLISFCSIFLKFVLVTAVTFLKPNTFIWLEFKDSTSIKGVWFWSSGLNHPAILFLLSKISKSTNIAVLLVVKWLFRKRKIKLNKREATYICVAQSFMDAVAFRKVLLHKTRKRCIFVKFKWVTMWGNQHAHRGSRYNCLLIHACNYVTLMLIFFNKS